MVDGQLKNITRAEAYQLQSTVETNSRRSTLAVKEHRDVDFGECSIIETIVSVTLVKKNMERDRQKHCIIQSRAGTMFLTVSFHVHMN